MLPGLTYPGAPLDDVAILERIPQEYAQLLAQQNGFIALWGGIHLRGACSRPVWHSLAAALDGPAALSRLFPPIRPDDLPFGQSALGVQLVLRRGVVWRLDPVAFTMECLRLDLAGLITTLDHDPSAVLDLEPLARFRAGGEQLLPGQLLAVGEAGMRAVPAEDLLFALSAQWRDGAPA